MWVFVLIVVQVIIAAVVIFVLKRLLDKELVQAALEKLQGADIPTGDPQVDVRFCPPLSPEVKARVQSVVRHKSPAAKVVFSEDPSLKGGLVITVAGVVMDFSMTGRLKNFWSA